MTKPATTETAPVKAKTAPITAAQYLAKPSTENQDNFLQFVLAETGIQFKTAAERSAFATGVKAAGLYARYQASKREAK